MSNSRSFVLTDTALTVFMDGHIYTIDRSNPVFPKAKEAIKKDDWEAIPPLMNKAEAVNRYAPNQAFQVVNGRVLIEGEEVPEAISNRIISFIDEDAPYEPLLKFWARLKKSTSYRARNELYKFMEASNIGILPDGRILCYKVVGRNTSTHPPKGVYGKVIVTGKGSKDFVDLHTKTVQQGIGDIVEMPRAEVDDDCSSTCSRGLKCVASY